MAKTEEEVLEKTEEGTSSGIPWWIWIVLSVLAVLVAVFMVTTWQANRQIARIAIVQGAPAAGQLTSGQIGTGQIGGAGSGLTGGIPLTLAGADCNLYGCTLPAGWVGIVPANVTCSGDLRVNGTNYFDSVAETGAVGYSGNKAANVTAAWGAHCAAGDQRATKEVQVQVGGCGLTNGCTAGVGVCDWSTTKCYWYPSDPK